MNTHLVLKRIPGVLAEPGAEVDASEWRNARLLVEQRYLKGLDGVEAAATNRAAMDTTGSREQIIAIVVEDIRANGEIAAALRECQAMPARSSRRKQRVNNPDGR